MEWYLSAFLIQLSESALESLPVICSNEIIFSFPRFSLLSWVMKSNISFLSILLSEAHRMPATQSKCDLADRRLA